MEELPDEVSLVVLSHIEPLRDTAAVSGTCRRWRRLMLDPHLWSLFHRRTFPTLLTTTSASSDSAATAVAPPASAAEAPEGGWRHAFAAAARLLKKAMNDEDDVKRATRAGYDVLPLAAAWTGCLPLAERAVSELRDAAVAAGGLAWVGFSPERSLVDECLFRACTGGFAPMAQLFLGAGARMMNDDVLCAAVRSGNRQLVTLLLDHAGGSVLCLWGPQVLRSAASRGDAEMLKLLVERGATTQSHDVIANAAQSGSVACVQLLIDHGFCFPPSPNSYVSIHFAFGGSGEFLLDADLVGYGVMSGNVDVVRLLCQQKRSLASHHMVLALNRGKSPSMELLQLLLPFLERRHWYACLISSTLCRGDVAVCRFLVEHGGLDINVTQGSVGTALYHAVASSREKLAQCLLACGALPDAKPPGMRITTALAYARQHDTPTSRLVLDHHAAIKRRATATATNKRKRADRVAEGGQEDASSEPKAEKETKKAKKETKKAKKKEPAAEKVEERELEVEVRRLAKLDDKAKLDLFTLRRMLRARGVLAGDMPTRKLALLQLAVDWLRAGN